MRVLSRKALLVFAQRYPRAYGPLDYWYRQMSGAFPNFSALRQTFPGADQVGRYTVFNIGGNKYRLIAEIQYQYQKCFIRHVLTHAEYDQKHWQNPRQNPIEET